MRISRRRIILSVLGITICVPFSINRARADNQSADLRRKLAAIGLAETPPLSVVDPASAFNGGLRYDESQVPVPPASFVIQPCARVDDIGEAGRIGILPLFHIVRVDWPEGTSIGEGTASTLTFLIRDLGLDPNRLAIVSTSAVQDYAAQMQAAGIEQSNVVIRPVEEAKAAGNGSGFFRHPQDPKIEFPTAGLYYWTGNAEPAAVSAYPLPEGWLEIGEINLSSQFPLGAGFGLERLQSTLGDPMPDWESGKRALLDMIDRDFGGDPPPGRALFADS